MKTIIRALSIAGLLFVFGFEWPERVKQGLGPELALPNFTTQKVDFDTKTPGLLKTGIHVKKFDYVYFDAEGQIDLGPLHRNVDAGGILAPHLVKLFNRIEDGYTHGRLFAKNGNDMVPATNWTNAAAKLAACGDPEAFTKRRANYFTVRQDMELAFFLNDKQPENNKGSFKIRILIIPLAVHISRNKYNKCPVYQPEINRSEQTLECPFPVGYKAVDFKGLVWVTSANEDLYHGTDNYTFRGLSKEIRGCQCTYAMKTGQLVTNENVGTFDFALAQYRQPNPPHENLINWQHVALDVWPHDAYKAMQYEPMTCENIYWK